MKMSFVRLLITFILMLNSYNALGVVVTGETSGGGGGKSINSVDVREDIGNLLKDRKIAKEKFCNSNGKCLDIRNIDYLIDKEGNLLENEDIIELFKK